jgi:hypothetical protein
MQAARDQQKRQLKEQRQQLKNGQEQLKLQWQKLESRQQVMVSERQQLDKVVTAVWQVTELQDIKKERQQLEKGQEQLKLQWQKLESRQQLDVQKAVVLKEQLKEQLKELKVQKAAELEQLKVQKAAELEQLKEQKAVVLKEQLEQLKEQKAVVQKEQLDKLKMQMGQLWKELKELEQLKEVQTTVWQKAELLQFKQEWRELLEQPVAVARAEVGRAVARAAAAEARAATAAGWEARALTAEARVKAVEAGLKSEVDTWWAAKKASIFAEARREARIVNPTDLQVREAALEQREGAAAARQQVLDVEVQAMAEVQWNESREAVRIQEQRAAERRVLGKTSRFHGVSLCGTAFHAEMPMVGGKRGKHLGSFPDEFTAAAYCDRAARGLLQQGLIRSHKALLTEESGNQLIEAHETAKAAAAAAAAAERQRKRYQARAQPTKSSRREGAPLKETGRYPFHNRATGSERGDQRRARKDHDLDMKKSGCPAVTNVAWAAKHRQQSPNSANCDGTRVCHLFALILICCDAGDPSCEFNKCWGGRNANETLGICHQVPLVFFMGIYRVTRAYLAICMRNPAFALRDAKGEELDMDGQMSVLMQLYLDCKNCMLRTKPEMVRIINRYHTVLGAGADAGADEGSDGGGSDVEMLDEADGEDSGGGGTQ